MKKVDAKKEITKIVFSHNGILQMHGFYIDQEDKNISFDIIIDFKTKNREELLSFSVLIIKLNLIIYLLSKLL